MMKLGLQIPSFTWPAGTPALASTLARVGQAAEEAGFASLWVMDHFFQIDMIGKAEANVGMLQRA
jgi:alkanesulfonate monooxygenase SsuD/methylene tetrahydromethanopterin reductase-like flavin-dependent oxidoreductase (luciferase family)